VRALRTKVRRATRLALLEEFWSAARSYQDSMGARDWTPVSGVAKRLRDAEDALRASDVPPGEDKP